MKKYDRTEMCPKCGGVFSRRQWVPKDRGASQPGEGVLRATCADCGYAELRAPRDADAGKPLEPFGQGERT